MGLLRDGYDHGFLVRRLHDGAGDFAFVPAWTIHAEGNRSDEDSVAIVVRSSQEAIVVNMPDLSASSGTLGTT